MTKPMTLEYPVTGRNAQTGEKVTLLDALNLRRPTAKDDVETDDLDGPFLETALIARLAERPEALIERMDAHDLGVVSALVGAWRRERADTVKPGEAYRLSVQLPSGGGCIESVTMRRVTGADKKAIAKLTPYRAALALITRLSGLERKTVEQLDCADFEALMRSMERHFFPRRTPTPETSQDGIPNEMPIGSES